MKNLWNETDAAPFINNPLQMRVYSSRLLGQEPSLVLHGGGNTSVKINATNLFGTTESILYVKGSGWDLATIEAPGFAPVKMDLLMKMARLEKLSDTDMVREQKAAMTNPSAPAPSVEAILHALIPYTFVDHTHADAVVAISNTPNGTALIREIFPKRVLIMDYVMPGFVLARDVFERTQDVNWQDYDGLILLHHGVFTWGNDAKSSYDRMIDLVSRAESYLKPLPEVHTLPVAPTGNQLLRLAELRRGISKKIGTAVIAQLSTTREAQAFSRIKNVAQLVSQGPLTPDHVIHTKRTAMVVKQGGQHDSPEADLAHFEREYREYFERHSGSTEQGSALKILDTAPRWAVWPELGTLSFGPSVQRAQVVTDITRHTVRALQWAEALGGWKALPEKDIFDVEYWELEQAKLKKSATAALPLAGKIALVTGAASGIGRACVENLRAQGAAVMALDLNPLVTEVFKKFPDIKARVCDVTDAEALAASVEATIAQFGGLDIVITNAGAFLPGAQISEIDASVWQKNMDVNFNSHFFLLKTCIPFLKLGIDPAIVVIASKNVPAPGPGAAAYSAAKAGLTQLARVAALELGTHGIRVNVLHPNAVFDTAIWTPEVLANRAKSYGLTVEEYKTNNVLKTEVTSRDVATLACAMAGPVFAKTTGAQVAVDGGNDRVI